MASKPLPDLPGVYYCIVEGEFGARRNGQIFTFKTDSPVAPGAGDAAIANSVAIHVANAWSAFTTVEVMAGYTGTDIKCYPLHSPTLPAAVVPNLATGGVAGAILPTSVARVVRHNVQRRGRGSQSRTYLSPVAQAVMEPDGITITPTFVTALSGHFATFLSTVLAALNGDGTGSWSYVQLGKGSKLSPVPATYAIVGSQAEPLLSNIRRRTGRNG